MQADAARPISVMHVKTPFRDGGVETLVTRILGVVDAGRVHQKLILLGHGTSSLTLPDSDSGRIGWRGIPFSPFTAATLSRVAKEHGADLIHTHDMRSNLVAFELTRVRKIPWIASIHGWLGPTHSGRWRLYEKLEGQLVRAADRVMVNSTATQREVESCGGRRVRVIHHGIPLPDLNAGQDDRDRVRTEIGATPQTVVVGVVSRVHPGKGLRNLVMALESLIAKKLDVMGLIVGDGLERPALQEYIQSRGLERAIRLTGYIEDQNPLLAAMDIVALPTLKDSLPFSILDGMALAKPVVTTTVGDLPLAVENGRNGFLVAPGEVPPLIEALEKLIVNAELRRELGLQGREDVAQRFSTTAMARNLENMYREVLKNGHGAGSRKSQE